MVGQQGPYVFVLKPDNTVTLRQVQLGQRHADSAVISAGVKEGEQVIAAGQLGLTQGKKVPHPISATTNSRRPSSFPFAGSREEKMKRSPHPRCTIVPRSSKIQRGPSQAPEYRRGLRVRTLEGVRK